MSADRPAQFDGVAGHHHLVEVWRHLAFIEPLDDELDFRGAGGRADRIATLGLIAVGRGQPHVDVLAGDESPSNFPASGRSS